MLGEHGVIAAVILFGIGTIGLVLRRDLVVKLLALGLVNSSVVLCLISIRSRPGMLPPLLDGEATGAIADPLPQALVLSAIVINFAVLAVALVFVMRLVERYHTTDSARIARRTRDEEGE